MYSYSVGSRRKAHSLPDQRFRMDVSGLLGLGERELVACVGAGGKKTAMGSLAEECARRGLEAGYTTTTHMPPPAAYPLVVAESESLSCALAGRDRPLAFASEWVTNPQRAAAKVRGFDPGVLDPLFERGAFDWLLVKADGARRREFKAPGPDEPVVPTQSTHVVVVASVRAVGSSLEAATVHRPQRVAAITGLAVGDTLTPASIGAVLASEAGGLNGIPDGARVTPLVNKADTPALRETARAVIRAALDRTDRFARGLVSSFETGALELVAE